MYIERYVNIHKKTWRYDEKEYDEKEINRLCVPIMNLKKAI